MESNLKGQSQDILDFTSPTEVLGKPSGSDLISGNITAPALFAMEENPYIEVLILTVYRHFDKDNLTSWIGPELAKRDEHYLSLNQHKFTYPITKIWLVPLFGRIIFSFNSS